MNFLELSYRIRCTLNNVNYRKLESIVSKSQSWTRAEVDSYHLNLMVKLLKHCSDNVPFYKRYFEKNGISWTDFKSLEDIQKLPIVTKSDILRNPQDFKAKNIRNFSYRTFHTGGTTGKPFEYFLDLEFEVLNWLIKRRTYASAGFRVGEDKIAVLAGGSLVPQKDLTIKQKLKRRIQNYVSLPITSLNTFEAEHFVRKIKAENIRFIRGYPSAIKSFILLLGNEKSDLNIKAVFTTAEVLSPEVRGLIEEYFSCTVIDQYGAGDGGGNISQEFGANYLRHNIESTILDTTSCAENDVIELVFTNLYNFSMPFIRYAPGDRAKIVPNSEGPLLFSSIEGRVSDIIKLSNGTILNGLSLPFEAWTSIVKQFQLVQLSRSKLELRIVPDEKWNKEYSAKAKAIIQKHCGIEIDVVISVMESLPLPDSGKLRYIIGL